MNTYSATSKGISYFGNWIYDGVRRYTKQQFSRCIFYFKGSTVRVYLNSMPNGGRVGIELDGKYVLKSFSLLGEENKKTLVFETVMDNDDADRIHELIVCSEKVKERKNAIVEIICFEAEEIVDYAEYLRDRKILEYNEIRNSKKTVPEDFVLNKVPYKVQFPYRGVQLKDSIFSKLIKDNKEIIKKDYGLEFFCEGEGPEFDTSIPGPGWSHFLPASNDARLVAGAYNTLRWEDDPELKKIADDIIDRIEKQMRSDGYYNYYPESESFADLKSPKSERKNYDRVFWTRAMIYADEGGNPKALNLARRMNDWLENANEYLPHMLDGLNSTNAGPGLPLMANTRLGKKEDIITEKKYFDQEYFFEALKSGMSTAFVYYPGIQPHCYAILILETLIDEYRATGEQLYLDSLKGAWEIWNNNYKHIGGAAGICEVDGPYPPKSYYITTGHNGETCGSVFWSLINMRMMQLFPGENKYAEALEECLFNAIAGCRTAEGGWTRYHVRFHGEKELGRNFNTCCEVSSTMFIPTIPSYIYSENSEELFINLYIPSLLKARAFDMTVETHFPADGKITLCISNVRNKIPVNIRIPSWQNTNAEIKVNGEYYCSAVPGQYAKIDYNWGGNDTIEFNLNISPRLVKYRGDDQPKDNSDRYAMLCGPVLMAMTGPDKEEVLPLRNRLTIEPTIPRINVSPESLLFSLEKENNLKYNFGRFSFIPYYSLDKEYFTCYPIIEEK